MSLNYFGGLPRQVLGCFTKEISSWSRNINQRKLDLASSRESLNLIKIRGMRSRLTLYGQGINKFQEGCSFFRQDKELDLIAFSFSGLFKITPDHFEPTADLEALSLCQKPGTFKFHESIPQIQCTKLQFLINLNNFCQDICSYAKKTCLSINRVIYYAIQAMIGHKLLLYDSKFYATSEMKTRVNYE